MAHASNPSESSGQPPREAGGHEAALRPDVALRRIGEALASLRYGSVLAIVQDGVVVQIERTEKTRLRSK